MKKTTVKKKRPSTRMWYWHVHHGTLAEAIRRSYNGVAGRRKYIKRDKAQEEIPLRLRLMKPIGNTPMFRRLFPNGLPADGSFEYLNRHEQAALKKLHKAQCHKCPGKMVKEYGEMRYSIFPYV